MQIIGTPEGTRDRLFAECAASRVVEKAATGVFKRRGYCELTTPYVEYYDLISSIGQPVPQESMMNITDRTGKIMVMRPDCTVAIARLMATKLKSLPIPLRLYYNQTVFRSDDINIGARSEIDQCGVELIGASGIRADLEVISMALDVMDACGLTDGILEIGHAGYFQALLSALMPSEEDTDLLRSALERKEYTSYRTILEKYGENEITVTLSRLPRMFGGREVLVQAQAGCPSTAASDVLAYLLELDNVLCKAGYDGRITYDLGLIHSIEYYTGMIFRGYGHGAADTVISGGRYDSLMSYFGTSQPAVGFAVDVDAVTDCIPLPDHRKPDTLVWYALDNLKEAVTVVNGETKQSAMLSCASSLDDAIAEARTLGAARLVIIDENGRREVVL